MNKLIEEAYQNAIERGEFKCPNCGGDGCYKIGGIEPVTGRDEISECECCNGSGIDPNKNIPEMLMAVITEISKADEAMREGRFSEKQWLSDIYIPVIFKTDLWKNGFKFYILNTHEDHLTQAYIKLMEIAGYLGIEIDESCTESKNLESELFADLEIYLIRQVINIRSKNWKVKESIQYAFGYFHDISRKNNIDIEEHVKARMDYNNK